MGKTYTEDEVKEILGIWSALKTGKADPKIAELSKKYPAFFNGEEISKSEDYLGSKRILVVDDEKQKRFMFKGWLEDLGCVVGIAESGKQAFRMTRKNPYDIIHMDLKMPDWDGLDAIISIELTDMQLPIVAVAEQEVIDTIEYELLDEPNVIGIIKLPVSPETYKTQMSQFLRVAKKRE